MAPDLIYPAEARLLALERKLARGERDLRALRVGEVGLAQGVWDAWGDVRVQAPTSPPTCTTDFAAICACLALTLKLHDSTYGDTTITYDSVNKWWVGCKQVSYPGTILCGARSMPLWYYLFGDNTTNVWNLTIKWHGTASLSGNVCPTTGKTCADTPNRTQTANGTMGCTSIYYTTTFLGGAQGSPWATGVTATLTVVDP
jgi:hypothetical protein